MGDTPSEWPLEGVGRESATELGPVLVLSALISTSIFFVEPLEAALVNWTELSIGLGTLVSGLAGFWAAGAAIVATLGLATAWLLGARATAIGVAIYVGLWTQANVLVWSYGEFDGTEIDWSIHAARGWIELAVWAALLLFALWRPAPLCRLWVPIAGVVVLMQAASVGGLALQRPERPETKRLEVVSSDPPSGAGFSHYSLERNVIVIVLDALQSDTFAYLLRDPEFEASVPPGFTFRRNAVSHYISTQFSLQSILTSRLVPQRAEHVPWKARQLETSVAVQLARQGFDATVTTFAPVFLGGCQLPVPGYRCVQAEELLEDDPEAARRERARSEISSVARVAFFRLVPHVIKPRVYSGGSWRIPPLLASRSALSIDPGVGDESRLGLRVLERISRDVRADGSQPRFRFLHLYGAHPPVTLDRDCRLPEKPTTRDYPVRREQFAEVSRCILGRVFDYLRLLDGAGAYDASLILIVSDHGSPVLPVDLSTADPALPGPLDPRPSALDDPARGLPLVLVKEVGARGPLRISDAPVSLCDVPASIFDALGMEHEFGCRSMFSSEAPSSGRRHFRYPAYAKQQKLTARERSRLTYTAYVVEGHSWMPGSWQPLREEEEESAMDGWTSTAR